MLTLIFCFLIFVRMLRHYSVIFLRFLAGQIKILSTPKNILKISKVLCQNYLSLASQNHLTSFDSIDFLKLKRIYCDHKTSIPRNLLSHFGSIVPKIIHISFEKTKTNLRNFLSFDQLTRV